MGNLDLWDKHAAIPTAHVKAITGKDYQGSSPKPHYLIWCLTDMFGPVGKGFGWQVLAEDFTLLGETHLHWCRILFWWVDAEGRHEFQSYGQTKAAYMAGKGDNRYHKVDEDAPKKSLTDAIVKAASQIGIASDIFLGRWDDSNYVADLKAKERAEGATPTASAAEIQSAAEQMQTLSDLPALAAWWKALNSHAPHVAAHTEVIAAKDARKAQLQQKAAA